MRRKKDFGVGSADQAAAFIVQAGAVAFEARAFTLHPSAEALLSKVEALF